MAVLNNKIRIFILAVGLILFSVLTISSIVEANLNKDYISFQLYRNNLRINRFRILDKSSLELEDRGVSLNRIVQELDLSFYIFKGSALFSIYRYINKSYNHSLEVIDLEWDNFINSYYSNEIEYYPRINQSLLLIISEVENIHSILTFFKNKWDFYYVLILCLNLFIFLFLLIAVYVLSTNNNYRDSTAGIMTVRNALIQGQEQERLRISLELHDKVAQDLFACRILVNEISINSKDEGAAQSFVKSLSLIDASIKEVRDLSYSLRPPALQAIGLDSAIQSYVDNFSKKEEIPITFKAVGLKNKNIDETVSINLYRILQETLNNTLKHAHAEHIDVKLIYTHPYLLLKIEDDGVGFKYVKSEMKAKGRNKLGLPGINERVSLLGGELIINTEKGEGTKILIKVPIVANEEV